MKDLIREQFVRGVDSAIISSIYKLKHESFRFIAHDRKKDKMFVVTKMEFCKVKGTLNHVWGYDPTDEDSDGYTYHGGSCVEYEGKPRFIVVDTVSNTIIN